MASAFFALLRAKRLLLGNRGLTCLGFGSFAFFALRAGGIGLVTIIVLINFGPTLLAFGLLTFLNSSRRTLLLGLLGPFRDIRFVGLLGQVRDFRFRTFFAVSGFARFLALGALVFGRLAFARFGLVGPFLRFFFLRLDGFAVIRLGL